MSDRLFVELSAEPGGSVSWLLWNTVRQCAVEQGELESADHLSELAEQWGALPCYALVPGELVSWHQVSLPKGGRVGQAALPYQMEERLCSDLDSVHIAHGVLSAGADNDVLIVDRSHMDRWYNELRGSGLKVVALLPDYAVLPENVAVLDGERAAAHLPGAAVAMGQAGFAVWWQLAAVNSEAVHWYCAQDAALPEFAANAPRYFQHRLNILAESFAPWSVNLLSGDYVIKAERSGESRRLKWPLILMLAVLLIHWLDLGIGIIRDRNQAEAYDNAMADIYRETFPGARVVNARSQMRSQLNALQGGGDDSRFMPWLDRLAGASKGAEGIKILQLQFDQREMKLSVAAPSYDAIDQWVARLAGAGFDVNRGAFGQLDNGISGQLELREKAQ